MELVKVLDASDPKAMGADIYEVRHVLKEDIAPPDRHFLEFVSGIKGFEFINRFTAGEFHRQTLLAYAEDYTEEDAEKERRAESLKFNLWCVGIFLIFAAALLLAAHFLH